MNIGNIEYDIRELQSQTNAQINVIMAEKCDSHRPSTTSLSENIVVAKTSYINQRSGKGFTSFNGDKLTVVVKKKVR